MSHMKHGFPRLQANQIVVFVKSSDLWVFHPQPIMDNLRHIHQPIGGAQQVGHLTLVVLGNELGQNLNSGPLEHWETAGQTHRHTYTHLCCMCLCMSSNSFNKK